MAVDTLKSSPEAAAVRPIGYMKQLDGVRGLAIAAVLIEHFVPKDSPLQCLPWGAMGVRLFFVLSGFLITSILLECRSLAEDPAQRRPSLLRRFYIRRFLRIFPVYYLTLFAAAVLDVPGVRDTLWVHAAYLSNWYFVVYGPDPASPVFHFWSLAVEEQFYLVWPWLMLFLPQRWLLRFLVGTIVLAPLVRLVLFSQQVPSVSVAWTTPSCLDTLGMGALLAVLRRYPAPDLDCRRLTRIGACAALLPCAVLLPLSMGDAPWPLDQLPDGWLPLLHAKAAVLTLVFGDTAMALVFVWVVDRAATGFRGPAAWFLEWLPLVYLGRISYGVYVFHNFMPGAVAAVARWLDWPVPTNSLVWFSVLAAVTLLLAALSWHGFEKPINDLKRWFPYRESTTKASVEALARRDCKRTSG